MEVTQLHDGWVKVLAFPLKNCSEKFANAHNLSSFKVKVKIQEHLLLVCRPAPISTTVFVQWGEEQMHTLYLHSVFKIRNDELLFS